MKNRYLGGTVVLGAILLVSACGGGGGSSGSSGLTGTWKGIYDDGYGFYEMDVTVSGTNITDVTIGTVSTGYTGTISEYQSNVYGYDLSGSGGGWGGFITDSSGAHAGLVDVATPAIAVLQKGATSLPMNYVLSDVAGSWSGYSVHLAGGNGDPDTVGSSSATVTCPPAGDCSFSGVVPTGSFSGTIPSTSFSTTAGVYAGTYTNSTTMATGTVWIYLAPDKTFAASWACDNGTTPVSDQCLYSAWNK
jgi:hypothetical protein